MQFDGIGLRLRSGQRVLSGVSGGFKHSQMHAVLGPSGSGMWEHLCVAGQDQQV